MSYLIEGVVHSPTFIFIECKGELNEEAILKLFGFEGYYQDQEYHDIAGRILLHDDGNWVHVMDDWRGTLYYMDGRDDLLKSLSQDYRVFWFSIGDCDLSYDFTLYLSGKLVREFVVDSPGYTDRVVRRDFGQRLPAESALINHTTGNFIPENPDLYAGCLMNLAGSLGIKRIVDEASLKVFRKP